MIITQSSVAEAEETAVRAVDDRVDDVSESARTHFALKHKHVTFNYKNKWESARQREHQQNKMPFLYCCLALLKNNKSGNFQPKFYWLRHSKAAYAQKYLEVIFSVEINKILIVIW